MTVRDTGTAARLMVATIELTVHRLVAAPASLHPAQLEDELVAMLFRYLTGDIPD